MLTRLRPPPQPKLWGDTYSPEGVRKLAFHESVDCPYQTFWTPTVQAYKRGLFREVHTESKVDDGLYSIGQIQPGVDFDAPSYVQGSSTGKGVFFPRGQFSTRVDTSLPAIVGLGSGNSYVTTLTGFPTTYVNGALVELFKGRGVKNYEPWFSFYAARSPFTSVVARTPLPAKTATGLSLTVVTMVIEPDDPPTNDSSGYPNGFWRPYVFVFRNNAWEIGDPLGYPDERHGHPGCERAGPNTLVLFQPTFSRPGVPVPPRPFVVISFDNGMTWGTVADSLFTDVVNPASTTTLWPNSKVAATSASFDVFPVDSTQCFVTATSAEDNLRYVGLLNFASTTIGSVHSISEPMRTSDPSLPRALVSVGYTNKTWTLFYADPLAPSENIICRRTIDWNTFSTDQVLPFPAQYTGEMTAYDEKTLLLPVYDGANYVLYQSTNSGQTWRRRGLIRAASPAPEYDFLRMQRFGYVTVLKRDGVNAPINPAQPWVCDASKRAPA